MIEEIHPAPGEMWKLFAAVLLLAEPFGVAPKRLWSLPEASAFHHPRTHRFFPLSILPPLLASRLLFAAGGRAEALFLPSGDAEAQRKAISDGEIANASGSSSGAAETTGEEGAVKAVGGTAGKSVGHSENNNNNKARREDAAGEESETTASRTDTSEKKGGLPALQEAQKQKLRKGAGTPLPLAFLLDFLSTQFCKCLDKSFRSEICLTLCASSTKGPSKSAPAQGAKALSPEALRELKLWVDEQRRKRKVVVFAKETCPYCIDALEIFGEMGVKDLHVLLINEMEHGAAIQDILQEMTGARTVPRIFIDGAFFGGHSDLEEAYDTGELAVLLKRAGAL